MASIIQAGTASNTALTLTSDTSGELQLRTNNGSTTALTLTTGGNINIPTTGARITGDFSNATFANRVAIQTSTTNGNTGLLVIPNGTGTTAQYQASNNSDPTNSSLAQFAVIGSTDVRILSNVLGTGTYLPITIYTGGSERLRIDTSGNVGIGTTSPGALGKLVVSQASSGTAVFALESQGSWNSSLSTTSGGAFIFSNPAATERMRITSGGQVLIGTTTSSYADTGRGVIELNGSTDSLMAWKRNDTNFFYVVNSSSGVDVWNTANTYTRFATNGAERMRIESGGGVLIGTTSNPNGRSLLVNGTVQSNNYVINAAGGEASFTNTSSGDQRPLFIQNSSASGLPNGTIYISNTNNTNGTDYNFIQCNSGGVRFIVYGNGQVNATGAYTNTSDARIKKDIVDATPKLDKLMQVRVVNYVRTDHPDNIKEIGVIAQELEEIFPTLVSEIEEKDKDGNVTCPDRKLVKYSVFVPILIKAMQEQQAMIDELKAEVAALKGAQ